MNEIDPATLPRAVSDGPQTNWEAFSANFSANRDNDQFNSRLGFGISYSMDAAYQKKVADIEKITGQPFDWKGLPAELRTQSADAQNSEDRLDRALPYSVVQDRVITDLTDPGHRKEDYFNSQVRALSDRFPAVLSVLDKSIEETRLDLKRQAEADAEKAGQSPNLTAISGFVSGAAGSMSASLTDPMQLPLMAAGFNVKAESVAGRIVFTMLNEAAINAGQTAVIKLVNEGDNARAGVRHGLESGIEDVAMAAVAGGLFGGTLRGVGEGGGALFKMWRGAKIPPETAKRLANNEMSLVDVEALADTLGLELSPDQRQVIHRAFEEQHLDDALRPEGTTPDQALVTAAARRHAADPENFPEPSLVEAALRDRASDGPQTLSGDEFSALLAGDREVAETFKSRLAMEGRQAPQPARIWTAAEFSGDWAAAAETLRKSAGGEITGMFQHSDVGAVDVVWGRFDPKRRSQGYGLAKIAGKHPEVMDKLPDILSKAKVVSNDGKRVVLDSGEYVAVLALDDKGTPKTWLMTAYRKNRRSGKTIDRSGELRGDGHSSSPPSADANIARSMDGDKPDIGGSAEGPTGNEFPVLPAGDRAIAETFGSQRSGKTTDRSGDLRGDGHSSSPPSADANITRTMDGGKQGRGATGSGSTGQALSVVTPAGRRIEVRQEIVDASQLVKASGELQPRDRSRAASDAQISEIASKLDPALLMHAATSDRGAPVVGPDGVVESGNGRVAALLLAAEAHPEKFAAYRQALSDAGFDVPETGVPLLVSRRTTALSDAERLAFVNESNSAGIASMSATEKAGMDVHAMDGSVLSAYVSGPVNSAANRNFVAGFLNRLPSNERFGLLDANGQLNADGIRRIENAMIAAAYGEPDVIARFAETPDDNVKSIMGAMSDVAGAWAALRRDIAEGVIDAGLDVTENLTDALRLMSRARDKALSEKRPVATVIREALGQLDLLAGEVDPRTRMFVQSFYKTDQFSQANGRDIIAAHLNNIVRAAQELGQPQLFGDATAISPTEMIANARPRDRQADFFGAGGAGEGSRADGAVTDGDRPGAQDLPGAGRADPRPAQDEAGPALGAEQAEREFKRDLPDRSIDEIFEVAPKWQADLDVTGRIIAQDVGAQWKNPGIKDKTETINKMPRKGYRHTSELTDVVRGGFVVDTVEQADRLVEKLGAAFQILDEGWKVKETGYFDRKVLVKFADGTVGELQIWPPAIYEAKVAETAAYTESRSMKPGDPRMAATIEKQQMAYAEAVRGLSSEWSSTIDGSAGRSGYSIRKTSSDLAYPESYTSNALTSVQESSFSSPNPSTAQARYDSVTTAGRPSQSKNLNFISSSSNKSVDIGGGNVKPAAADIRPDHLAEPQSDAALSNAEARAGALTEPQYDANGNPVSLFEFLPVTDGDGNVRLVGMREALAMADEAEFHADILGACKL